MKYKTLNLNDSKLRELFELKSNEDLILTEVKKVNGNSVQIEVAVVKQESEPKDFKFNGNDGSFMELKADGSLYIYSPSLIITDGVKK